MDRTGPLTRRTVLRNTLSSLAAFSALDASRARAEGADDDDRALIAITLDLEMSRHYPTWEQTHWDYEKGNLDTDTKRYAVEAARRVKAHGGVIQGPGGAPSASRTGLPVGDIRVVRR